MPRRKRNWLAIIVDAWTKGVLGCIIAVLVFMFGSLALVMLETLVEGALSTIMSVVAARSIAVSGVLAFLAVIAWYIFNVNAYRWRKKREIRRIHAGLCRKCGYDIRESDQRCPECGALILRSIPADLLHLDT